MNSNGSTEIMLDLDNCSPTQLLHLIQSQWRFLFGFNWPLAGTLGVQGIDVRATRHGFHVRIRVRNKIPNWELNFMQLALGSDYRRECMNLRRLTDVKRMKVWNVLFASKFDSRGKITSQERPNTRLSKELTLIVRGFQKRRG